MIGSLRRRMRNNDAGVAMITALSVLAVLAALSATVAAVSTNNVANSNRDRMAGAALNASDAGVAQAIEYIRANSVFGLSCPESANSETVCAGLPAGYSNPTNPQKTPLDQAASTGCTASDNCARVWIGVVRAYNPPLYKTGKYRVHSEGVYGNGPATRNVIVDLEVTPLQYPIGVFANGLQGNGGTSIYASSLFTRACVSPRWSGSGNGTRFDTVEDPYWGIPPAAHSTASVSTSNNCGNSGKIHTPSAPCPTSGTAVLKYDQSGDGGPVTSGACFRNYTSSVTGDPYPPGDTTKFTNADLEKYGYRPRGLSDAEYASLKTRAQALGTYNVNPNTLVATLNAHLAAGINQPVVYFDNGNQSLRASDFPGGTAGFGRAPGGTCSNRAVTIVVANGNLTFQGGNSNWFDAVIFVPDGNWTGNGGYNILGTLFANNVSLGGNEKFELDPCLVDNMPGPVMKVEATVFREDDSKDS